MKMIFNLLVFCFVVFSLQASNILPYRGFDPDAKIFIDRTSGLTDTEKSAVNKLVKDLKENNLWDDFDIIYPMVGSSAANHEKNLKTNTFDVNGYTAASAYLTHSTNGIKSDGTTVISCTIGSYDVDDFGWLGGICVYITETFAGSSYGYLGSYYATTATPFSLGTYMERSNLGAYETGTLGEGPQFPANSTTSQTKGLITNVRDNYKEHYAYRGSTLIAASTNYSTRAHLRIDTIGTNFNNGLPDCSGTFVSQSPSAGGDDMTVATYMEWVLGDYSLYYNANNNLSYLYFSPAGETIKTFTGAPWDDDPDPTSDWTDNGSYTGYFTTQGQGSMQELYSTGGRLWWMLQRYNGKPSCKATLGFIGIAPGLRSSDISTLNTIITDFQTSLVRN